MLSRFSSISKHLDITRSSHAKQHLARGTRANAVTGSWLHDLVCLSPRMLSARDTTKPPQHPVRTTTVQTLTTALLPALDRDTQLTAPWPKSRQHHRAFKVFRLR